MGYTNYYWSSNYDLKRHVITLTIDFAADFVDIFEVRGQSRARMGASGRLGRAESVTLRYRGLDEVERTTSACFYPDADSPYDKCLLDSLLDLGPGEWCRVADARPLRPERCRGLERDAILPRTASREA